MTDTFSNSCNSCRNQQMCVKVQQKYRKDVVLVAIFCFAYLKIKDTKESMLSDRVEFSSHKLCKNKRKKICTQMSSKVQCFIFQPWLKTYIYKKSCNILSFKNIYALYKSKYHSVYLYTCGFRKHRSNMDMANNYVYLFVPTGHVD